MDHFRRTSRSVALLTAAIAIPVALVVLALWALNGPLAAGWARAAGTPPVLLGGAAPATPTPTP